MKPPLASSWFSQAEETAAKNLFRYAAGLRLVEQRQVDQLAGHREVAIVHGGEIGDHGGRENDRQPAVNLPDPLVPVQ